MNPIDDDLGRGIDLADLLAVLLAQPDAETAIDGMHKVAQIIGEHARSIKRRPATQLVTDFLAVDEPEMKSASVIALIGGNNCAS